MYRVLTRIVEGKATMDDVALLKAAAGQIEGHTICAFGEAAAWPVQGMLRHFWHEFEYYVNTVVIVDAESGPPHERGAADAAREERVLPDPRCRASASVPP
ncbi:MAG: hypothetical protein LKM39_02380 [Chiayiivirga sp.]|jgi:NADH-quinone oxidoreductase subunit F|nr:hypothetical protein [Chiayiivirga sp.]